MFSDLFNLADYVLISEGYKRRKGDRFYAITPYANVHNPTIVYNKSYPIFL